MTITFIRGPWDLANQSPTTQTDSYTVQSGDYCALLAQMYYINTDEIKSHNSPTWGWVGCNDLQLGAVICLSSGDPLMPAVVSSAECGPQLDRTRSTV
jgi:hypothetical protein